MTIELLVILALLGVFFFGPLTIALIALAQVRSMRNRLDEVERFAARRELKPSERMNRIEGHPAPPPAAAPAPPPPPPSAPEPVRPKPVVIASPLQPIQPRILQPAPEPEPVKEPKESVPLENLIGERILPRIGVIAIVLGMSLLVWYSITNLGPAGKIALAAVTGAGMVVGGVMLRRRPHLQLLGSCLVGGGWAVLYITGYAAHAVEASRIIENKLLGFLVLLAVSEAALVHALKYKSETIAGLAYLLTIVSLFLSPEPGPPAWAAIGLSGAVLVALAWWQKWIRLCTFGAALLYVAEGVWLASTPPASILPAFGVLVALWLMWTLPDYFHKPATEGDRTIHGLLVAINFIGVLIVGALIQKWFQLQYMGWVWFTLGALYAIHAFAGRKAAWRVAHHASLLFSAVLLAVAAHQLAAGLGPVIAWMGISAALFAWGLWRKDEVPRVMGIAGLVVSAGRMWVGDWRMEHAWIPALIVAALFYAVSAMISKLKRSGTAGPVESRGAVALSHLAAVSLGLVLWNHPPELTSGALFALAGLTLVVIGPRLGARELSAEGICYLTVAAFFVAAENLTASRDFLFMSRRLASTVPVLLAWLAARLLLPRLEKDGENLGKFFSFMLMAGLLALLGFELGAPQAPVAWALACGAWYLWSRLSGRDFEFLIATAGAAATVVAYSVVRTLEVPGAGWDGAAASGALILAIFVGIHLASRRETPSRVHALSRDGFAAAMSVLGFVLLDREMSGTWLTGSWAVLGFALAAYGFLVRDRVSRWSSLLVLGVCLGKVVLFDLATFEMPVKIATLITLGTVMVALSFVYARHHRRIVVYLAGKE